MNEVIEMGSNELILSDSLLKVAQEAEKRIEAIKKIKQLVLAVTNEADWVDQNGKPYLQTSGAEKVARLFGISWRIDPPEIEHEEGGHFRYTYKGYFSLGGVTIEAIGSRSSKDGFFKKYKYENNERIELPPSEIDRADVQKAAYTNLLGNGITRLLGIRNLSYDDLKTAGLDVARIQKIEYRKRPSFPAEPPPKHVASQVSDHAMPAESPSQNGELEYITEPQRKRFFALAKASGKTDDEIKEYLKSIGLESTKDMLKSQYERACEWASGGKE